MDKQENRFIQEHGKRLCGYFDRLVRASVHNSREVAKLCYSAGLKHADFFEHDTRTVFDQWEVFFEHFCAFLETVVLNGLDSQSVVKVWQKFGKHVVRIMYQSYARQKRLERLLINDEEMEILEEDGWVTG